MSKITEVVKNVEFDNQKTLELETVLNSMIKKAYPEYRGKFEIYTDHNKFLIIKLD